MTAPYWLAVVLAVYLAIDLIYCWYMTDRPRKPRTALDNFETTLVVGLLLWVLVTRA